MDKVLRKILLLILLITGWVSAVAKELVIDGILYRLDQERFTAHVIAFTDPGYGGHVVIPSEIVYQEEGDEFPAFYLVEGIGSGAFSECSLKSVDLPKGLSFLADRVFFNCTSLRLVGFSGSLSNIGWGAFVYFPVLCGYSR